MKTRILGKGGLIVACALAICLAAFVCACSPKSEAESETSSAPATNDTIVMGELDAYSAEVDQEAAEGASMGFDEESNLQQEKTAGFSGGAVTSNLEELEPGITGAGEREPAGMKATTGEPPLIPHGSANGTACMSCHEDPAESAAQPPVPQSHLDNSITDEECMSCHQDATAAK